MLSPDILVTLQKAISYLAVALLVVAAYSDIRTFRIPNLLVLAIAVLGIIHLVLSADPISAIYAVGASVLFFVIGLFLFSRGIVGGGDVKLLAATVLLIRYPDLFKFFVRMSVFGALLSIAVIATRNYLPLFVGPRLAAQMEPFGAPSRTVLRYPPPASSRCSFSPCCSVIRRSLALLS